MRMKCPPVLPLLVLALSVSCSGSPPGEVPDVSADDHYTVREIIESGDFEEQVEPVRLPVFNCRNQTPISYSIQRERSIEESVDFTVSGEISAGGNVNVLEVGLALGAEYGWGSARTRTDGGELTFEIAPGTYPVYFVEWSEQWELGYVILENDGGHIEVPYKFLQSAQPHIVDIEYVGCDEISLAIATIEAGDGTSLEATAHTYVKLGKLYHDNYNYQQAYESFVQALQMNVSEEERNAISEEITTYAKGFFITGELRAAENIFRVVRMEDSGNDTALFWLAWALYEQGDHDDALSHFELCIDQSELDFYLGRCHAGKGFIYNNRGLTGAARAEFEKALAIYPDQEDVQELLVQQ